MTNHLTRLEINQGGIYYAKYYGGMSAGEKWKMNNQGKKKEKGEGKKEENWLKTE